MPITTKEKELMKELITKFNSTESLRQGNTLIASKFVERTKVNLLLLKYFLKEMKQSGVFITVGRPHQYIAYLLKLHKIPQDNLFFIDMISQISSNSIREECPNVHFANGPHEINLFRDMSTKELVPVSLLDEKINLEEIEFILIDDFAALQKYNTQEKIEEFIEFYTSQVKKLRSVFAPIVLDVSRNKKIYNVLKRHCDRIFKISLSDYSLREIKTVLLSSKYKSKSFSTSFRNKYYLSVMSGGE